MTVRAINKVEFGGPLAVTVCHYLPFIVDNTPPEILGVGQATYDLDTKIINMEVNAT